MFFRGEQLTESLKQYKYSWDKVMALLSSICRYMYSVCLIWSFEIL